LADPDGKELARDRTEWAEDRTIMANERTYAGWMRTGLAAVGIGLAFNALFSKLEPSWLPRALATLFILAGVLIFYLARNKACSVLARLSAHYAKPVPTRQISLIAILLSLASLALIVGIWMI
jgi:putative membrane protein